MCGKYYLKKNIKSRAVDLFRKAVMSSDKNTKINREVIVNLLEFNLLKDADKFFALFPPETQKSLDYIAVSYLLADKSTAVSSMVTKGKELLSQGHQDPLIYQVLIKKMIEDGQSAEVQPLIQAATQKWPEQKNNFAQLGNTSASGAASPAASSTR